MAKKNCLTCGVEFDAVDATKTCSRVCRAERNNELDKKRPRKKAYYEENREKIQALAKVRRGENPEKYRAHKRARERAFYAANPERLSARRAYKKALYAANVEKKLEQARARRAANPETYRARGAAYRAANVEKIRARQNSRNMKRNAVIAACRELGLI
jgi:hypothetical protein